MEDQLIQFDGLYCCIEKPDNPEGYIHNSIYRFYRDGTVIDACITEGHERSGYFPIGGWFDKDSNAPFARGKYKVKGNKLTLKYKADNRKPLYEGEVYDGFIIISDKKYVYMNFDQIPKNT